MNKLLMTPGPTNVPQRVLEKMSENMLHHRTSQYSKLFEEFNERLKYVFQTKNSVLTFPSSGTGGLESAIINPFSKGDKILAVSIGDFGNRFINIAKIHSLKVDEIVIPWGKAVTLEDIKKNLRPDHKGLIITHNETSTAVVNPIEEIGNFLKDKDVLYIVDAVSSLGGIDIKMDEWNIDILISASQKALMSPPGLAFVGVSEKALYRCTQSNISKYYFDYLLAKKYLDKVEPQNPYTPAISLILAANESLKIIEKEGLQNVFLRHQKLANKFRDGIKSMNLKLYAQNHCYSNTVTAISFEEEGLASRIKNKLDKEYNIIISGGQGFTRGKLIRVGHMGCVNDEMIDKTLYAIQKSL